MPSVVSDSHVNINRKSTHPSYTVYQPILHSQTHLASHSPPLLGPSLPVAGQDVFSTREAKVLIVKRLISSKNTKVPLSFAPRIPTTIKLTTAPPQFTASSSQETHLLLGGGRA